MKFPGVFFANTYFIVLRCLINIQAALPSKKHTANEYKQEQQKSIRWGSHHP